MQKSDATNGGSLLPRTGDRGDVLARFYHENEGKSLRRLPSWIVPENAFAGFGIADPSNTVQRRVLKPFLERSDWNVLTWCCRTAEHGHPEVAPRLAEAAETLKGSGIELLMELDPRLMRNEFLSRHPDDHLRLRQFGRFMPDAGGVARFEVRQDYMCDYENTSGMKDPYSGWKPGHIVAVRAVKGASMRKLAADEANCTADAVTGVVSGLADGETLLVEVGQILRWADGTLRRRRLRHHRGQAARALLRAVPEVPFLGQGFNSSKEPAGMQKCGVRTA